ncbi:MAG: sugar transferase, partial [Bacteroidia bacterium]
MTNTSAIFVQGAFLRPHNVQLLEAVENRANVYLLGKRVIDIIFSLVICVFILSWLLPLLAILIKIDSKGPVFFRQKRSGFQGKTFDCFKLRTMRLNANSDDL